MNEIQYNGFKTLYNDSIIHIIREIDLIGEKDTDIDRVTNCLEKEEKLEIDWKQADCLIAYSLKGKNAEDLINRLSAFLQKKEEDIKHKEETPIDERMDIELEETTEKSIKELFRIKLSLPSYQRPYAWGRENICFFLNDIRRSEEKYDYGIIVLIKNEKGGYQCC